jgi:DM9 repeat
MTMRRLRDSFLLAATLALLAPARAEAGVAWVKASGGDVPPNAVAGGREAGGEPLYVCRANLDGGVHGGKVRKGLRGCNIGLGGKEQKASSYEVLVQRPLAWISMEGGEIPTDAIAAGREGATTLYVCRAAFAGGIHSGKIQPAFGGCKFGVGGREQTVTSYEVLAYAPMP